MTPQDRARKSAEAMWSDDGASQWMGLRLTEVDEGRAVMALDVVKHHCNGHGMCHGGVIFTLADSCFAFACNSYNQVSLAQQNAITFCAPGHKGDRLTANAVEVQKSGRSGVYDVTVTNQDGTTIAVMRGNSRTIKGSNFDEAEETT